MTKKTGELIIKYQINNLQTLSDKK